MRMQLIGLNYQFNDEQFFNIYNVLCPHLWVPLSDPNDPTVQNHYQQLWHDATNIRGIALKYVNLQVCY